MADVVNNETLSLSPLPLEIIGSHTYDSHLSQKSRDALNNLKIELNSNTRRPNDLASHLQAYKQSVVDDLNVAIGTQNQGQLESPPVNLSAKLRAFMTLYYAKVIETITDTNANLNRHPELSKQVIQDLNMPLTHNDEETHTVFGQALNEVVTTEGLNANITFPKLEAIITSLLPELVATTSPVPQI